MSTSAVQTVTTRAVTSDSHNQTSTGGFTPLNTTTSIFSSPTSTESAAGSSGSPGVSTGAIIGVAVGCALAGFLIGIIAAFILLRRLKGTKQWRGSNNMMVVESKAVAATETSSGNNYAIQLSHFLLETTPEEDIVRELWSLDQLIHQHVETHYHLRDTNTSFWTLCQALTNLGFTQDGSGPNPKAAAALCVEPRSRHVGLRHVISYVVFESINFHSPNHLSMLPAPLVAFLQSVPQPEPHIGDAAMSTALSKWRALSGFILHPNRRQRTPLPINEGVAAVQALNLASALNVFLQHFAGPVESSRHEQTSHLQAVILECAKLGYVLLSQPSDWRFIYKSPSATTRSRPVVVCAGLEKLGDNHGVPYGSPRRVADPVLM